uniref:Ankyrin repeat and zinc finger domain-containing protein 1-like n=1 Tax=Phallusia mammillata TaxID=59560 RepID=A0A6F9D6A5_9ASCI|nr:ankyrin repeat and zinc finger domain-containing protein 1-like [Phallusia mammillata]
METIRPYKVVFSDQRRIKEVVHGFKLAKKSSENRDLETDRKETVSPPNTDESTNTGSNQCLTCKCLILHRDDQIEHYKGDWHRYNLKLKLLGQPVVSEEEFADNEDVFSISGSDTEGEDNSFNVSSDENRRLSLSVLKQENNEDRDEQFDNRRPKLYFQNSSGQTISIYKKVLYSRQNSDLDSGITQVAVDTLNQAYDRYWAVILLSAGHFAAAVFQGSSVIVHKTFHRYVVRAKRGVAQSLNDSMNKAGIAKSAGANLRRYNEIQLEENIKSLLKSWKEDYLDKCSHIFLRIPQYRKTMFYGGKDYIFDARDNRIRSVPFVTRRPTFNEVQRVHQELYSVTVHGKKSITEIFSPPSLKKLKNQTEVEKNETIEAKRDAKRDGTHVKDEMEVRNNAENEISLEMENMEIITSELETFSSNVKRRNKKKNKKGDKSQPTKSNGSNPGTPNTRRKSQSHLTPLEQLNSEERDLVNKLYTACRTSDLIDFNETLNLVTNRETEKVGETATSNLGALLSMKIDTCGNTLLHIAAKSGNKTIITKLLEHKADPTVKNDSSFLPYCVCANKEARNSFRKFRAKHPDLHDYTKAQVPSPLTEEKEEEIKKKQSEKKKAQKAARKEKERNQREERQKKKEEQEEKDRFLALSDREKRLIAVERRLMQDPNSKVPHTRRCFLCAEDMLGKVPFEYLGYKFCSMKCLKTHKNKS